MDTPSPGSGNGSITSAGLPRSPFMPVRRGKAESNSSSSLGTPRGPGHAGILKGSMTPTAVSAQLTSLKPAASLAPLTASNLSSYSSSINNQQHHDHLAVDSDATSNSTNSTSLHHAHQITTAGTSGGLGLGRPGLAGRPAGQAMLNSTKRYTRQMAPASSADTENVAPPSTLSASDLRAKARVTSGSAPRRKIGVPGAERADPATGSSGSSHAAPSSSMSRVVSRPETPTSSAHRRPRSNSRPPPVPSVPSRPASRAGGEMFGAPSSRPQSRMDDYGPDAIISAGGSGLMGGLETPMRRLSLHHSASMRRDSSDSSLATVNNKQENVLVCVRVRPPAVPPSSGPVRQSDLDEAWDADDSRKAIRLLAPGSGAEYRFDAVVTGSGNERVYQEAARPLILSSMNGYDAVIFAYGQTASGKTFTLSGTPSNPGIIPQAISDIFTYIRSHPQKEFLLRASYIEIYNEQLRDLLVSSTESAGQTLKIRQDENKRFFVSPLREEVVTNEAGVQNLLERGEKNRHTAGTDFNARSSRSHTVFQIVIESRDVEDSCAGSRRPQTPGFSRYKNLDNEDRSVVSSRLSLIDLAGSEKATSQADRRVEGAFINKSLLTLEKVIAALTEDKARSHVPYRDSKLTQILQPSLSGEARVAVICTINPSPVMIQESTSTLKFAQRVKKVTLHAEKNEVVGDKALIIRYEQTISEMTAYISQLEQTYSSVPATPRHSNGSNEDANFPTKKSGKNDNEVAKAKEDRAKLLGYIVNAGNIDEKRNDAPRPVSPVKPVNAAELPFLQEQLLDAQDKIGELEETADRQRDEIAALKAQLAASALVASSESPDSGMEALKRRNEELEKQCREFRTILANEDQATALRSERRLAAREWSDKLHQMQRDLDKARSVRDQAVNELMEERKKSAQLEKTLLKKGMGEVLHNKLLGSAGGEARGRRRSGSLDGLSLLSSEAPMLDIRGSYLNLDEIADSPAATPVRSRLR